MFAKGLFVDSDGFENLNGETELSTSLKDAFESFRSFRDDAKHGKPDADGLQIAVSRVAAQQN